VWKNAKPVNQPDKQRAHATTHGHESAAFDPKQCRDCAQPIRSSPISSPKKLKKMPDLFHTGRAREDSGTCSLGSWQAAGVEST
jgi:hypothetical protein